MIWLAIHYFTLAGHHCPISTATNTGASLSTLACLMMLTLWNRPGLCTLDPTWLLVNLHLHHWVQISCYLMHIVHLYMAVHSGARCISTPIGNWMLHIGPNDAIRHLLHEPRWCSASQLWPKMCLRLIFVNWCILCGDPWMLRTMFLLMLHYVLIYLLDHLFLDDGATFCFNF